MPNRFRRCVSATYRCRRCWQYDLDNVALDLEINRGAWAAVLDPVIRLARQNRLSVEVLAQMRKGLRQDLAKMRSRRKHEKLLERKPAGFTWSKVGNVLVDGKRKLPPRVFYDRNFRSVVDLAIPCNYKKMPILKPFRMQRAKSI